MEHSIQKGQNKYKDSHQGYIIHQEILGKPHVFAKFVQKKKLNFSKAAKLWQVEKGIQVFKVQNL